MARTRELEIAEAVKVICLDNNGGKMVWKSCTCHIGDERFKITIEPSKLARRANDSTWDQVTIDGINCGNRCGGVYGLMVMLGLQEPLYPDFADRHYIARRDEIAAKARATPKPDSGYDPDGTYTRI